MLNIKTVMTTRCICHIGINLRSLIVSCSHVSILTSALPYAIIFDPFQKKLSECLLKNQ